MSLSKLRFQLWLPTAFLLLIGVTAASAAEEPKQPPPSGLGSNSMRQPFSIFSGCPPAVCNSSWDDEDSPAGGYADFTDAGVPVVFNFTTGYPITWECNEEYGYCEATYGVGGTFTVTGVLGRFTGEVTSGSIYVDSRTIQLQVTFTGHWSTGQPTHGDASVIYEESNGTPNATLNMSPGP